MTGAQNCTRNMREIEQSAAESMGSRRSLYATDAHFYALVTVRPAPEVFCFRAIRASVHDRILKVYEHNILQTTCRNFIKFTPSVQLGKKMM